MTFSFTIKSPSSQFTITCHPLAEVPEEETENSRFTVIHNNNLDIDSTARKTSSILLPIISSSNSTNPIYTNEVLDYTRKARDQLEITLREMRESETTQEIQEMRRTTRWCSFSERHGCILGEKGVSAGFACIFVIGLGLLLIPLVLSINGR